MVRFSAVSEISILDRVLVPTEGNRWLILLLIVRILSLQEVIKILLFRNRGILATVLKRNLGLFLFSSINVE